MLHLSDGRHHVGSLDLLGFVLFLVLRSMIKEIAKQIRIGITIVITRPNAASNKHMINMSIAVPIPLSIFSTTLILLILFVCGSIFNMCAQRLKGAS